MPQLLPRTNAGLGLCSLSDTRLFSSMWLYVHRDPIKTSRDAEKPGTATSTFTQFCWLPQIQVQCCFTHCELYGLRGETDRQTDRQRQREKDRERERQRERRKATLEEEGEPRMATSTSRHAAPEFCDSKFNVALRPQRPSGLLGT